MYVWLLLLVAFVACNNCKQPVSNKAEMIAIENMLDHYFIAIENENFLMIEQSWKKSDSIIMLGTNSRDILVGWESIKKAYHNQLALVSDVFISISDQHIEVNSTGNTAWFSQLMNYNFMVDSIAQSYKGMRFTGVLEKCSSEWKLVQGHLSVPANIIIEKQ